MCTHTSLSDTLAALRCFIVTMVWVGWDDNRSSTGQGPFCIMAGQPGAHKVGRAQIEHLCVLKTA